MNNFKSGFKGGSQKFGSKKKFGGDKKYDSAQRSENRGGGGSELFSATCSECGKKCDVPFKPSQDKPVYCSACFGMKKGGNELRGAAGNSGQRDRKPFGNGNVNTGPAYSSAPAGPTAQNILELKQQVSALEVKLNKILDLLNPPQPAMKAVPAEITKPVATVKKVAPNTATKQTATKGVKKAVAKKPSVTKTPAKKAAPKKTIAKKVVSKKLTAKAPVKKAAKKTK